MGKLLKIIFGIIGSLLLLLIIFAVVIVILVYDGSTKIDQTIIDKNQSVEEIVGSLNYDALETTKDDKLSYSFTEYKLSSLIYAMTKDVKLDPVEVNGAGVKYEDSDDGALTIFAPAKLWFFSTSVNATVAVLSSDSDVTLKLKEIKFGKLSTSWFSWIIGEFINAEGIQNAINEATGLNTTVKYEESALYITLKNSDIFDLIKKQITEQNVVYETLIDVVIANPDLFKVDFKEETKGFFINLNVLSSDVPQEYSMEEHFKTNYELSIDDKVINKVQELTTSDELNHQDAETVINFLIRGYSSLTSEEQNKIKELDLSSLGYETLLSKQLEKGYYGRDDLDVGQLVEDQIDAQDDSFIITKSININLSNANLNAIMSEQDLQGSTFAFYNDENKINYVMISRIYLIVSENNLKIGILLNLNGKELPFIIDLSTTGPGTNYTIIASLNSIGMGSVQITGTNALNLMKYLADYLDDEGEDSFIKVNAETNTVKLNLSKFFKGSKALAISSIAGVTNQINLTNNGIKVSYLLP